MTWLRAVADGDAGSVEAVRGYHGELAKLGLKSDRTLDDDLLITEEVLLKATRDEPEGGRRMHRDHHPSNKIIAEVAWMYYVRNLNQGEISDALSLSRPTVISYLKLAKERGIVCIQVSPEHIQGERHGGCAEGKIRARKRTCRSCRGAGGRDADPRRLRSRGLSSA